MNFFLAMACLFFVGSVVGWVIELLFRRFVSAANPERKWINPGFCTGPYLPLYGSGLCILFLVAMLERFHLFGSDILNKTALFLLMTVLMTVIEYLAGILLLKIARVRLWDYSKEKGNIKGIICPKFSFFWGVLGALYYFLVHPHMKELLLWLSHNLAFSFFIGMFFGVFFVDLGHSVQIVARIKRFAEENQVVVRYEHIKARIRTTYEGAAEKYRFFRPFRTVKPFYEQLGELRGRFEDVFEEAGEKLNEKKRKLQSKIRK